MLSEKIEVNEVQWWVLIYFVLNMIFSALIGWWLAQCPRPLSAQPANHRNREAFETWWASHPRIYVLRAQRYDRHR